MALFVVAVHQHRDRAAEMRHNEFDPRRGPAWRTALGPDIASFLEDVSVVEVMLNSRRPTLDRPALGRAGR